MQKYDGVECIIDWNAKPRRWVSRKSRGGRRYSSKIGSSNDQGAVVGRQVVQVPAWHQAGAAELTLSPESAIGQIEEEMWADRLIHARDD